VIFPQFIKQDISLKLISYHQLQLLFGQLVVFVLKKKSHANQQDGDDHRQQTHTPTNSFRLVLPL